MSDGGERVGLTTEDGPGPDARWHEGGDREMTIAGERRDPRAVLDRAVLDRAALDRAALDRAVRPVAVPGASSGVTLSRAAPAVRAHTDWHSVRGAGHGFLGPAASEELPATTVGGPAR